MLVEVIRSGFVEGYHRGSVVALATDGSLSWSIGEVNAPIFPRSCNKPLQAVGMLRHGLNLDGELLALVGGSHSGEAFHIEGVRRILATAGLDESELLTPADLPLDEDARVACLRDGVVPSPILMNCSGKHAGMLATCVANDWPTRTYLEPDHPLQVALAEAFADLTGEPIEAEGVDGCGAPLFSASLTGLARSFAALVKAPAGSPERRVADAFVAHPEYASGSRRDEAALLRAIPGAVGKGGAEACYGLALPDGRAVALKIDDGAFRARPVAMAAALRRLGVDREPGVDGAALLATGDAPLLGGRVRVGELRARI